MSAARLLVSTKRAVTRMRTLGNPLARGRAMLRDGRPAEAAHAFLAAARAGLPDGAFELARLYDTGRGLVRSPSDAAYWYRRAAEQGHVGAQSRLGVMLLAGAPAPLGFDGGQPALSGLFPNGGSLTADPEGARDWVRKAAEAGDTNAQATLGYMLAAGIGGPADPMEAFTWYSKAAATGHAEAALGLGTLHAGGHLGAVDHGAARQWFETAAAAGNGQALASLGAQHMNGWGGPVDYAKASDCLMRGASQGNAQAMRLLGHLLIEGRGVAKDLELADQLLRRAAGRGDTEAMARLGDLHSRGIGRPMDPIEAAHWYRSAAEQGHREARQKLDQLTKVLRGAPREAGQAVTPAAPVEATAAEGGDPAAQFDLGVAHATGNGAARDFSAAVAWWTKAADQGHALAMINLGRFHMRGLGVVRDSAEAKRRLQAALAHNPVEASLALGELYAHWSDPPDPVAARAVLATAAEAGDERARTLLADLAERDRKAG